MLDHAHFCCPRCSAVFTSATVPAICRVCGYERRDRYEEYAAFLLLEASLTRDR